MTVATGAGRHAPPPSPRYGRAASESGRAVAEVAVTSGHMSDLRSRLRAGLTTALRERDLATVRVLRTCLATIENAEAVPAPEPGTDEKGSRHLAGATGVDAAEAARRELTEEDVRDLVTADRDERRRAADEMARYGSGDRAERLRAEAAILDGYLA